MGDYGLKMDVEVAAPPEAVEELLTSPSGIARWWSSRTSGEADRVGGELRVGFPDQPQPFELQVVDIGVGSASWHVAAVPEWWAGTTIRFATEPSAAGTMVHFEHDGFDPENPVIPIITPAWAQILFRLKDVAEGSADRPFFDF